MLSRVWTSHADARRGAIVNLGSMSGTIANRPQPQTPYNVSKAAVHHITRCLATEWAARGVRVNAVAPTYIETPMVSAVVPAGAVGSGQNGPDKALKINNKFPFLCVRSLSVDIQCPNGLGTCDAEEWTDGWDGN